MASVRKLLRSSAFQSGGPQARDEANELLQRVDTIADTGYVKMKYFDYDNPALPSFETSYLSAVRLICVLSIQDRKLGPWTKRGVKGNSLRATLHFSSDEDAVLARLMLDD
jgi:hypothetical protein